MAAFASVPEILIYPNQYLRPIEEIFGKGIEVDPGNNVFLREWGFKFIEVV